MSFTKHGLHLLGSAQRDFHSLFGTDNTGTLLPFKEKFLIDDKSRRNLIRIFNPYLARKILHYLESFAGIRIVPPYRRKPTYLGDLNRSLVFEWDCINPIEHVNALIYQNPVLVFEFDKSDSKVNFLDLIQLKSSILWILEDPIEEIENYSQVYPILQEICRRKGLEVPEIRLTERDDYYRVEYPLLFYCLLIPPYIPKLKHVFYKIVIETTVSERLEKIGKIPVRGVYLELKVQEPPKCWAESDDWFKEKYMEIEFTVPTFGNEDKEYYVPITRLIMFETDYILSKEDEESEKYYIPKKVGLGKNFVGSYYQNLLIKFKCKNMALTQYILSNLREVRLFDLKVDKLIGGWKSNKLTKIGKDTIYLEFEETQWLKNVEPRFKIIYFTFAKALKVQEIDDVLIDIYYLILDTLHVKNGIIMEDFRFKSPILIPQIL